MPRKSRQASTATPSARPSGGAPPPATPASGGSGARPGAGEPLTLRQKIGQTMIMLPDRRLELKLGHGSLSDFFSRYPISGFFLGWKLFDGVAEGAKLAHIRARVQEYQAASSLPLIFQQDYEAGVSLPGMTSFPAEMALGAANSENLAHDYGKAIAQEARSVGVRWVLHPVADLNLNPLNPTASMFAASRTIRTLPFAC